MLDLNIYKVSLESDQGKQFIKIGEHTIPYYPLINDYMQTAIDYLTDTLQLSVLGVESDNIVTSKTSAKVVQLYKFSELAESAKRRALDDFRKHWYFTDDFVLDSLIDLCSDLGFYDTVIEYSLDYSTYIYAIIGGKFKRPKNVDDLLENYPDPELQKIILKLKTLPNSYTCDDISLVRGCSDEDDDSIITQFRDVLFEAIVLVDELILNELEVNFDFQQTDEYLSELLESNDCMFSVRGYIVEEEK
jgi:hypothetical protein